MEDIITGERIAAVIDPYSGTYDYAGLTGNGYRIGDKPNGDFGCDSSPLTNEEGTGGHNPGEDHTPLGFEVLVDSKSYWARIEDHKSEGG